MKKWFLLLIGILTIASCTKSNSKIIGEDGLEYTLSESKDGYIVTGIGKCTDTDIVIPSTFKNLPVIGIGDNAFFDNNLIFSIDIPNTVKSIGKSAFQNCSSLESIEIPKSVISIGENALASFSSSLIIYCETDSKPSEWESDWNELNRPVYWGINENNYLEKDGLVYVVIDGNAVVTGKEPKNITNAVIPSTIVINGNEYNVKSIGDYAFSSCDSLTSAKIPNSVTSIGSDAFEYCSSLTIYCKPSSKPSGWDSSWNYNRPVYWGINENNYLEQDGLVYVVIDGKAIVTGHEANITDVVIPSTTTINGTEYNVTSIGDYAFSSCDSLTSVKIPNSVTTIGKEAFSSCDSLSSIEILNSVTNIGENAFRFCDCLIIYCEVSSKPSGWDSSWNYNRPVYWGVNENNYLEQDELIYVVKDGNAVVTGHKANVTNVVIPSAIEISGNEYSVIKIGDSAFSCLRSLTSATIPSSVTSIGEMAFYKCSSLTSIEMSNSLKNIGNEAFWSCSSLTSLVIPSDITSIGKSVFYGCRSLQYNEYGNCLYLGDEENPYFILVSAKDMTIEKATISDKTKIIMNRAFSNCDILTSVVIPNNVTSIKEEAFYDCDHLSSVTLPNSITSIEKRTFTNCSFLPVIEIPNSITSIEEEAFTNCINLKSIIIPNSVTSIGKNAFHNCSLLTIYCEASSKPSGWSEYWNEYNRPVYWNGQWSDVDGTPVPSN